MKKQFLMENSPWISRVAENYARETVINDELLNRLICGAIKEALNFYTAFLDVDIDTFDFHQLGSKYKRHYLEAKEIGLFEQGGVREKDHLNFWCLSQVLNPSCYIESGVFIGSSLHAFLDNIALKKVIAIDPDLSKLKLSISNNSKFELVGDKDFSELKIDGVPRNTLAYFDDHIDSANRIICAKKLGIKYLIFDDSTGLQGITQRLYPALPTVPMIMKHDLYQIGDEISWSFNHPKIGISRQLVTISKELLEQCALAKRLIKRVQKLPDLGDHIPLKHPTPMNDMTKYILELY